MCDIVYKVFDLSNNVICSSWIQGVCTVFAGFLALGAGWLAYIAATRKTRLQEKREEERRIAYRFTMKLVLTNLLDDINLYQKNMNGKEVRIFVIPKEMESQYWENHALLDVTEIILLHRLIPLLEVNYYYAVHYINKKNYDKYCCGIASIDDNNMESTRKNKTSEKWMSYGSSKEYQGYLAKCADMKDEEFKNSFVKIISILEELINKLK
jgi:hypothetical protein